MNDKNGNSWSKPDYESWQAKTVENLGEWLDSQPPHRFTFVVAMAFLGLIAFLVSDSIWPFAILSSAMLILTIVVLLIQRKSEGYGQTKQDCETEHEIESAATSEVRKADGGFGFVEHGRNSSEGFGSIRTPLDGEEKEASRGHPR